jgi:hypothetical protein
MFKVTLLVLVLLATIQFAPAHAQDDATSPAIQFVLDALNHSDLADINDYVAVDFNAIGAASGGTETFEGWIDNIRAGLNDARFSFADPVVGQALVDVYYTGPTASVSQRRVYVLASVTGEDPGIYAILDELVAVPYTLTGITTSDQRISDLASMTREVSPRWLPARIVHKEGVLFLRLSNNQVAYAESRFS